MRRPRSLAVLLALALAAIAADLAQAASTALPPLGADGHGVRLVQRGHPAHLVIVLSPKRYRAVARKQLLIVCAPVPDVTLGVDVVRRKPLELFDLPDRRNGAGARLRVPNRRGPMLTGIEPRWDWCAMDVRSAHRNVVSRRSFATIPLTPAGAAFVDERMVATRVILGAYWLQTSMRLKRFPPTRIARLMHAVLLASPAETPSPGRLGLYTDGRGHVYAAQSDRAGDLLFYEHDSDETRTNLLRYLQDGLLP